MAANRGIRACLNCGTRDIRQARLEDGIVPGYTELQRWVCNRCGHQGPEMLFSTEDARKAYEDQRVEEGALEETGSRDVRGAPTYTAHVARQKH